MTVRSLDFKGRRSGIWEMERIFDSRFAGLRESGRHLVDGAGLDKTGVSVCRLRDAIGWIGWLGW